MSELNRLEHMVIAIFSALRLRVRPFLRIKTGRRRSRRRPPKRGRESRTRSSSWRSRRGVPCERHSQLKAAMLKVL